MEKAYNKDRINSVVLSNLNRLAYFTAVVETSSFTAAAERLGITKAVVSQQVAKLEDELRTTLLIRSTRRVRTTEAGQAFYYRCVLILKDAEDAFSELAERISEPSGTLRLTAPLDYGINVVVPTITEFSRQFSQCKVEASFSDKTMDVMSENTNTDVAIRVGWLTEQHLQARKIGHFRQVLVASGHDNPSIRELTEPQEIISLPFIANTALREHSLWTFSQNELERQTIRLHPSILLDATLAVKEAVLDGAGLAILPDFTIADELASGRLIQVLPQWNLPIGYIYAVFPTARFRPAKVKAFIELLTRRITPTP
ncbi:LysR family transcriptional regulator [Pectobacterium zantedeschiae]|uniref:LysR family transcriptional regulator n=1 Tax=Pectobacterium zantedeschiae TaxID=2034769 RepID=A0A9X8P6D4_9GAMM|nr:LysR family transcriptional regulator [Pectobacterium zantedeschiae]RYC38636.1 LysR family transcriptional regulator [Pectobacterium zantedeschiae]RYC42043.1 LysR family transcriptional regulator [Pectobacterium zantedeschiae]RYC45280.1 LysR family transcriptional regulator [Pectobacterium zantedeschiae]